MLGHVGVVIRIFSTLAERPRLKWCRDLVYKLAIRDYPGLSDEPYPPRGEGTYDVGDEGLAESPRLLLGDPLALA